MGVGADGKDLSSQFPVTFQNVRVRMCEAKTVFQAGGVQLDADAFFDGSP